MISAHGLTKYYGDKCAVQNVNFDIQQGEIVGILGLNGAGKSTTLKILACLLLPSTGTVKINGLDVVEHPHETRKLVGFLPEVPPLYTEMTVEGFLTFAGELRGLTRAQTLGRLEEVLAVTNTRDVRGEVIGNLSHGYRQRVGIAQSIIHNPPVLILDEPISGLDPVQIVEVREMVRGLKGKHTILVSSHILSEISQTCDRILVIQDGQIVAAGTEEELTAKLAGGNRVLLTVRGEQGPILELLRKLPKVTLCTAVSVGDGRGVIGRARTDVHEIEVTSDGDVREDLARELVQAGHGLLQLRPAEAELESIFLRLTHRPKVSNATAAPEEVRS